MKVTDFKLGKKVRVVSNPDEDSHVSFTEEMNAFLGKEGVVLSIDSHSVLVLFEKEDDFWGYLPENLELLEKHVEDGDITVGAFVKVAKLPDEDYAAGVPEEMKEIVGKVGEVALIRPTERGNLSENFLVKFHDVEKAYYFPASSLVVSN